MAINRACHGSNKSKHTATTKNKIKQKRETREKELVKEKPTRHTRHALNLPPDIIWGKGEEGVHAELIERNHNNSK